MCNLHVVMTAASGGRFRACGRSSRAGTQQMLVFNGSYGCYVCTPRTLKRLKGIGS